MNNKGMAISSILYTILVLFLVLIFGILGLISSAKTTFDTLKHRLSVNINDTKPHVIAVEDDFIDNKINVTVTSRKYINSYYISQSNDEITKEEFNSNINKHDLEYPTGSFTTNYMKENDNAYYIYLKDIHDNVYKYQILLEQNSSCSETIGTTYNFEYTGTSQEFSVPCTGEYKVELWGAQGGVTSKANGGNGGYTSGKISLDRNDNLYVYVGSQPTLTVNSYNGGGNTNNNYYPTADGGGATDIRLVSGDWNSFDSLKTRIMVAAGGGGSENQSTGAAGGAGGGLNGYSGVYTGSIGSYAVPSGGTQVSGGSRDTATTYPAKNGGFGIGGDGDLSYGGGAGGSGYYGGGGGSNYSHVSSGGGGSSFISGYQGCNAIAESSTSTNITHTGQPNHYSGEVFTDGVMIDGKGCDWATGTATNCGANQPQPDGTNAVGHTGNGYARITLLYASASSSGLQYKISSNDLDNKSRITVGANESKTITITLKSLNSGNTKYELYYRSSNKSGVSVVSSDSVIDTIGANESKTIKVTINNNGSESVIIKFLTAGSTTKQSPTIDGQHIRTSSIVETCDIEAGEKWDFAYTGDNQEFTVPCSGYYKIEAWGAEGGYGQTVTGLGGYTSGKISLSSSSKLYVYVGGAGSALNGTPSNGAGGGFNGGGNGINTYDGGRRSGAGGGATDIRYFANTTPSSTDLNWNSTLGLNSRIMVAAGGGGSCGAAGGAGGGLIGIRTASNSAYNGGGGSQTDGSICSTSPYGYGTPVKSTFGAGSVGVNVAGGGGGGYYGGGGGTRNTTDGSGGGGSSYISGHAGCIAIEEGSTSNPRTIKTGCTSSSNTIDCSKHYSGLYFTDTIMIDGEGYKWKTTKAATSQGQPQPDGTNATGHSGNGYARITYLGDGSIKPGTEFTFDYTGSVQEFTTLKRGKYKLEVWGAQGGSNTYNGNYPGGYGGYSIGTMELTQEDTLYIYVGGKGLDSPGTATARRVSGGYNGGADGWASGGGATHISLNEGLLSTLSSHATDGSILIVAGGGGGSAVGRGGDGGGYIGKDGTSAPGYTVHGYGGTQTAGGTGASGAGNGTFGAGGISANTASGGGGGGYYGGGGGRDPGPWTAIGPAGGGSGYIASSNLKSTSKIKKTMYCYGCTEDLTNAATFTVSTTGSSSYKDATNCPDGFSSNPVGKCAKSGNGYARITYIGD